MRIIYISECAGAMYNMVLQAAERASFGMLQEGNILKLCHVFIVAN